MTTVDLTGGVLTFTDVSSENNNLTVGVASGVYSFNDSATNITLGQGAIDAGFKGSGTKSISGPASAVDGIEVYAGGGTNTVNVRSTNKAITFAPTAGSNTINLCSNAPIQTANGLQIIEDVTVSPSGGTTIINAANLNPGAAGTVTIGPSTITGMIGPTNNKTINYSGGTLVALTVSAPNYVGSTIVVDSPGSQTTGVGFKLSSAGTVNVKGVQKTTGVTGSTSNDVFNVGTAAGSVAGLDAILAALTFSGIQGSNSLRIDDSGSATGNKTYTITPSSAQSSNSTLATTGISNINWQANGGSYASGLRIDGSNIGGCTFVIAVRNALDNMTIVGNGGNTNTLNLSALSGYTDAPNYDGTGVVTLSNGKTITYSGIVIPVPVNTVAPAVTPSPATVGQACSCTTGTWTGSPTSYSYQWKLDGSNVGTNSSSYTPVAAGTLTCTVTPSNAGGAGTPAVSNSVTVVAGGNRFAHLTLMGST